MDLLDKAVFGAFPLAYAKRFADMHIQKVAVGSNHLHVDKEAVKSENQLIRSSNC